METKSLKLESVLNSWTMKYPNICLGTEDGLTLASVSYHVADLVSLPSAVQTLHHYLKLKDGELAICNDPYAGGSLPSQVTLATAFRHNKGDALLILALRISTRPRINFGKTVDEDGLKIPPTPLGRLSEPTHVIVDAIASHPQSPDDFKERVEKGILHLQEAKASLCASLDMFEVELTRSLCQAYVQDSHKATQDILAEFTHGHSELQWTFEGGGKLRLQVENNGSRVNLDFTGTSEIPDFHLTESHMLGCAVRVLEQASNHSIPVNSGSLLAFNLVVPEHSAISSSSPASTTSGVLVGTSLICDMILRGINVLNPRKKNQRSASTPLALSFSFGTRSFFDLLSAGSMATVDKRGESGIDTWNDSGLSASVEDIEARFPLEILALKKRTDSGGQGDQKGGDGILKTYRLLEPAKFRWIAGYPLKAETNSNSGLGMPAEIVVRIGEEEVKHIDLRGTLDLPAGAVITALSRGGHAFLKD